MHIHAALPSQVISRLLTIHEIPCAFHFENRTMEDESEYSYLRGKAPLDLPYTTMPEMIRRHSQRYPKSIAHVYIHWETFEKENLTYIQLYESASKLAKGLMNLGIENGDVVALGTDNTPEWMVALTGIQLCGAVPLMFTFSHKDGRDIESLLVNVKERCKAIMFTAGRHDSYISIIDNMFTKGTSKGRVANSVLPNLQWSILISNGKQSSDHLTMEELCSSGSLEQTLPYVDPEDVAGIFMTSGSTGAPKLVTHSHYSILIASFHDAIVYTDSSKTFFNDRPFNWIGG